MDWKDILTAVLLTIIGSVVIAYSILYFQNWMAKKRLLKPLLAEVSHNVGVLKAQEQAIAGLKGIFAPAGLKELNNTSYLALRERGFLGDLPLEIQDKLPYLDFEGKRLALDMLGITVYLDGQNVEVTGVIEPEKQGVRCSSNQEGASPPFSY